MNEIEKEEKIELPSNQIKKNNADKIMITFDEFQKLDLRIGTIKSAERIPKSKKLLKLTVDLGENRIIVAGIAEHYSEEELTDKQVLIVANLQPVKLMGVESQGMVLASIDGSTLRLISPDGCIATGSKVS